MTEQQREADEREARRRRWIAAHALREQKVTVTGADGQPAERIVWTDTDIPRALD